MTGGGTILQWSEVWPRGYEDIEDSATIQIRHCTFMGVKCEINNYKKNK